MRVLYVFITVPTEGSQVHIESFVEAFRSLGETIDECGEFEEPYQGGKESWSRLRRFTVRLGWFGANIRHFVRTLIAARRKKSDVLLFRFDPLHRLALSVVILSLIYPVILEINAVRSIENHERRPRSSDWLDGLLMRQARRVFVVSERLREHLVSHYGIPGAMVSVVENGVDGAKFSPSVSGRDVRARYELTDRFVIAFVGSFRPWHGVPYLLAVARELIVDLPSAVFLLVGDGPDRHTYEDLAVAMGLSGHTVFVGYVGHDLIPEHLAAADVLMYPMPVASFEKGFYGSALKLFEYMAMGRPIVTSGLGQNSELIEDGVSGMLVPAENTEELKAAILRLSGDVQLRHRMGAAARDRVMSRYTWRANAEKVLALCVGATGSARCL